MLLRQARPPPWVVTTVDSAVSVAPRATASRRVATTYVSALTQQPPPPQQAYGGGMQGGGYYPQPQPQPVRAHATVATDPRCTSSGRRAAWAAAAAAPVPDAVHAWSVCSPAAVLKTSAWVSIKNVLIDRYGILSVYDAPALSCRMQDSRDIARQGSLPRGRPSAPTARLGAAAYRPCRAPRTMLLARHHHNENALILESCIRSDYI